MPTEQNTAGVGGAPLGVSDDTTTSSSQSTSPVADQISDLGDILLDKSIDDVQSNDFLPVGQNDVAQLDSMNGEVTGDNISVSTDNSTIVADDQSTDINTIDLGDIDLSVSSDNNITDNNVSSGETELNTDITTPSEATTDEVVSSEIDVVRSDLSEIEVNTTDTVTDTIKNANVEENTIDEIVLDTIELSNNSTNTENNSEQSINQTEDINTTNDLNIDQPIIEPVGESTDNLNTTTITQAIEEVSNEQNSMAEEKTINEGANEEITASNSSIDLGGISLDGPTINEETNIINSETQINNDNVVTEENNDNTDSINFDALENIDLPESTSIDLNGDGNSGVIATENNEVITTQAEELPEISLESMETTNDITNQIPGEKTESEKVIDSPSIEQSSLEETAIIEDINIPDISNIEITPSITSDPISSEPIANSIVSEAAIDAPVDTGINIDDKLASIAQAAEKVEEGIDLDSLVGPDEQKNSSAEGIDNNTVVTHQQDVVAPVAQNNDANTAQAAIQQDKKPLKMALVGMGIVAILGAGYFGYKTVFPMGLGSSEPNTNISGNIMPDLTSGDSMSGDILSGDLGQNSGEILLDDILSGSTNSGDTDIGVQPIDSTNPDGNTGEPTNTRTLDDIKNDADLLVSKARKLLIKATIAKNGPARISAFSIQKDVDSFVQTLANTTDITTLEASEKTLEQLSQRLTSLENRLNGSSN